MSRLNKTAAAANSALIEQFSSAAHQKAATENLQQFTRYRLREEGFTRKLLPFEKLSDDELDPQLGSDKPYKIEWKEPQSHGALSIPFAAGPSQFFIRGANYPVYFNSIIGPKYIKHLDELRIYPYDIRSVMTDHVTRDVMDEEDRRFVVDTLDAAMIGANQTSPFTNTVQWKTLNGGWDRNNIIEALKALPSGVTKTSAKRAVANNISMMDFLKWGRDEIGGDMSQDLLKAGSGSGVWTSGEFLGTEWFVTIKDNLVPNGTIYMLSAPEFLGRNYVLTDLTLHSERTGPWVEYYPWETIGGALGNVGGVARRDLQ